MIRIYIANLGAYNRGYLVGKWVELPICEEELADEIKEILLQGTELAIKNGEYSGYPDEEYAIHDYETDLPISIGEYSNVNELNNIAEELEDLSDYDIEILKAIMEHTGNDIEESLEIFESSNYVTYMDCDDFEDLAYAVVEECGYLSQIPEDLRYYFDYKKYGRELDIQGYSIASNRIAIYTY